MVALSGGDGGAANACFSCHGLEGQGDGDTAPRLAGLDPGYLHRQLEDYAAQTRDDDVMSPIAKRLTPAARLAVAAHYATLSRPVGTGLSTPAPVAYRTCIDCHGGAGEGRGPGNPAIAGQPAAYVREQLHRWKTAERRNDPRGVMRLAVENLDATEISAIAAWLETQPAFQPPDSAAASATVLALVSGSPAPSRTTHRPDR